MDLSTDDQVKLEKKLGIIARDFTLMQDMAQRSLGLKGFSRLIPQKLTSKDFSGMLSVVIHIEREIEELKEILAKLKEENED